MHCIVPGVSKPRHQGTSHGGVLVKLGIIFTEPWVVHSVGNRTEGIRLFKRLAEGVGAEERHNIHELGLVLVDQSFFVSVLSIIVV